MSVMDSTLERQTQPVWTLRQRSAVKPGERLEGVVGRSIPRWGAKRRIYNLLVSFILHPALDLWVHFCF